MGLRGAQERDGIVVLALFVLNIPLLLLLLLLLEALERRRGYAWLDEEL